MKLKMSYDESVRDGLRCEDVSLAKQSFKEECDINTICRRFGITGELPTNVRAPRYGDFTDVVDFQSALNAVREAGESFMLMPAHVRARFQNDPQQFLEFVENDSNRDEAVRLGLVFPEEVPPAAPAAAALVPTPGTPLEPVKVP